MFVTTWIVTIIISFVLARFSLKVDYKHNNKWVTNDLEDFMVIVLLLMFVPFVNLIGSLILLIWVYLEKIDRTSKRTFLEIVFFLNKDKKEKKSNAKINSDGITITGGDGNKINISGNGNIKVTTKRRGMF